MRSIGDKVRAFIRALNKLAREIDGAVHPTGHLSQAGIKKRGRRQRKHRLVERLALAPSPRSAKPENGEPTDVNARILTRKKANHARIGDTIKMHWKDGVIVPDARSMPSYFRRSADDAFLPSRRALCDQPQNLSDNSHSQNYAPRVFAALPEATRDGYREPDFKQAMERLFKGRKIKR